VSTCSNLEHCTPKFRTTTGVIYMALAERPLSGYFTFGL
jgi:hypothetical protein